MQLISNSNRGYSIVGATFLLQGLALGFSIGIYPVLMSYIEMDFGISRSVSSLGIPLVLLMGSLVSPKLGHWLDLGSPKKIMLIGCLVMSAGLISLSLVPLISIAACLWVGMVGLGQAMMGGLPSATIIANWYVVRRSTMIAISATGITAGMAVAPVITEYLIGLMGWRGALAVLGVVCLAIALPLIHLFIVKKPEDLGLYPDGGLHPPEVEKMEQTSEELQVSLFKQPRFWVVAVSFTCMAGAPLGILTHVVNWEGEYNIERQYAVFILSSNAVFGAVSKLIFGYLCDRMNPRKSVLLALTLQFFGLLLMLYGSSAVWFVIGAIVFSLGAGALLPCQAGFVSLMWGTSAFGRAMGCIGLVNITGIFAIPLLIGWGFEQTGGYTIPMIYALALAVVPALLLGLVGTQRE